MAEERTVEEPPFPPYFVRFIEERDERLLSELRRVETLVQHNTERIDELRQELERRFTEAKEDRQAIRQELERCFTEAREDRQAIRQEMRHGFTEARDDRQAMRKEISHLRDDMNSHFRWTMGIMTPIVLGILAIIIRVFFLGFGPTP